MTDIFTLNEAANAVVPVDLPGGGKLTVAGFGSDAVRPLWKKLKELERAQVIKSIGPADDKTFMALSGSMDKVTDDLAKVAASWTGITSNGVPLEVTPDNAVLICGANGPFKRQMLNAIAESEERFLGLSAS
jgi:hypothetical protein